MRQTNWDDLRFFLALVREGNVRSAAHVLGVSHSTVARRIEQIEHSADVRLFDKTKTGSVLTKAGEDMLCVAERIENEIHALQLRTFGLDRELQGAVVLTLIDAIAIDPVMDILSRFCTVNPKIELILNVSTSVANLDRREADLAIRFAESPADHLIGRRLMKTARAVYASEDYISKFWPDPIKNNAGWISFTPSGLPENWKRTTPFPKLQTHLRVSDMKTQLAACRSGMGLVFLPCFMCDTDPKLKRISKPDMPGYQTLWLLRRPETKNNARINALSDYLNDELKSLMPLLKGETAQTYELPT